jgi:hypothetical protein
MSNSFVSLEPPTPDGRLSAEEEDVMARTKLMGPFTLSL